MAGCWASSCMEGEKREGMSLLLAGHDTEMLTRLTTFIKFQILHGQLNVEVRSKHIRNTDAVEAHSCIDTDSEMSLDKQYTTVDIIQ